MQSIEDLLKQLDTLFEENEINKIDEFLNSSIDEAKNEGELEIALTLYNELIGFYREISAVEKLVVAIKSTLEVANDLNLKGTIPYATTALNVANAYRAMGDLRQSLYYYNESLNIYKVSLPDNDIRLAGLYNNISLLFQEMGDFDSALDCLKMAMAIVVENNAEFEIAVTYANLANTAFMADNFEEAKEYAKEAIKRFKERNCIDVHYCSALSALAMCLYKENNYEDASKLIKEAMNIVESTLGRNAQYERLNENLKMCEEKMSEKSEDNNSNKDDNNDNKNDNVVISGLELCKSFYEEVGRPMLEDKFPEYISKIAVGLVGPGSDCFKFDDVISKDHDWGPGFCLWVTKDTFDKIGTRLKEEYEKLPNEYKGYKRITSRHGQNRHGVMVIEDFYNNYVHASRYEDVDFSLVSDYELAVATNGEVFIDEEGVFTGFREGLLKGYPEYISYLKIAEDIARISQTGQYNYARTLKRQDRITADLMLQECIKQTLLLAHHISNVYPPHDKWLYKSFNNLDISRELNQYIIALHGTFKLENDIAIIEVPKIVEDMCECIARVLYSANYISDIDKFLDIHTDELIKKSEYAQMTDEELVKRIAKLEFEAFDVVKNEGGRASCQNDWTTFAIMRMSQYKTWNRAMLLQYIYDFKREFDLGHNLITEKYGRMMESTAPDKYEEIKEHFPTLSEQKKAVIEQIVALQMQMADAFSTEFPLASMNARSFHSYEDNYYNTSYETYLRGEISTYSDKMLQLYGAYVVECAKNDINIAKVTIENTVKMYGYDSLKTYEISLQDKQ